MLRSLLVSGKWMRVNVHKSKTQMKGYRYLCVKNIAPCLVELGAGLPAHHHHLVHLGGLGLLDVNEPVPRLLHVPALIQVRSHPLLQLDILPAARARGSEFITDRLME